MQLAREHTLLETQERSDTRKKNELQSLSEEISETAIDDPERAGKYLNFRDARPSAQAKRAERKIQQNKTQLKGKQAQQSVMTNQLISEKLAEQEEQKAQAVPTVA